MLPFLPPEILDLILDYLHDERTALNACCAVSKSWIPRARRHLFFHIEFSSDSPIESWIKAFPNPSTSPAHHTRVLSLREDQAAVDAVGIFARAWARAFRNVVDLRIVEVWWNGNRNSLTPFHQLFPTLKSLSLLRSYILPSVLPNFICSFPLLKDLELRLLSDRDPVAAYEWSAPPISPEFTGTLRLDVQACSVVHKSSVLPSCFRFARIVLECHPDHADLTANLVLQCSENLESISVSYPYMSTLPSASMVGHHLTATHGTSHAESDTSVRHLQGHKAKRLGVQIFLRRYPVDH